jgi:hypothetical protein
MVRAMRILFLSATLMACGPSARDQGGGGVDAAIGTQGDAQNVVMSRVYAHSDSILYRVDTQSLQAVQIGTMTGLGTDSMTDPAIDKTDHMVGISVDKLYTIDSTTGAVTLVKALSVTGFSSLSYIPSDLNDPTSTDILVSANMVGDVYQIEPTTGAATKIGSYGSVSAGKVGSSGDLIGVRGLGIYATVNVGTTTNDFLAKIDPATWKAAPIGTGTGFDKIFGLAYWAGTIYGFVDNGTAGGKIITINPTTGVGTEVLPGAVRWWGAGVTTDAPILQ